MTYIALFDCVLGRCQCLRLILRCGAQDCSPELKRERRSGHNDIQVLVITRIREMVYSRPGSIHPRGSSWDVRILVEWWASGEGGGNFPSEQEEIRIRSAGTVASDLQMWRSTSDSTSQRTFLHNARYSVQRNIEKICRLQSAQNL